jgi:hypothetical protein
MPGRDWEKASFRAFLRSHDSNALPDATPRYVSESSKIFREIIILISAALYFEHSVMVLEVREYKSFMT